MSPLTSPRSILPSWREWTFPEEPVEALILILMEESASPITREIAFPTGYIVPPLSAVPIVRIFKESDLASVWRCAVSDDFPHPPMTRPVQARNKEIVCKNLCMKYIPFLVLKPVGCKKNLTGFVTFGMSIA